MSSVKSVTVLVLCYNSRKTVIETLNSVKKQTYKQIHLIVSDDCSTDDTFVLVKKWVSHNNDKFLSAKAFRTRQNLGVSRHMNACLNLIPTDWFKGLAADDVLLPDCIEKYVDYIQNHECRGIVYANHLCFNEENGKRNYFIDYEEQLYQKNFGKQSANNQRKMIAKREVLCSPTCFTNKNDVILAGGYDLRIKNIEDWPIKMRLLDHGFKMHQMSGYTVLYRVENSISHSEELFFKPDFLSMERKVKMLYCYPMLYKSLVFRWNEAVTNLRYKVIVDFMGNRRNRRSKVINLLLGLFNTKKMKKALINIACFKKARNEIAKVCLEYGLE